MVNDWLFDHGWGNTHSDLRNIFLRENVSFEKGAIRIKTVHHADLVPGWMCEGDGIVELMKDYSSGVVISKKQFLYGEFECHVVLPKFRGSWSAFWLYPHFDDGLHNTTYDEIDWYEQFRKDNCLSKHKIQIGLYKRFQEINAHEKKKVWSLQRYTELGKELKILGVWNQYGVSCYINGRKKFEITDKNLISNRPMNIIAGNGVGDWKPRLKKNSRDNDLLFTHMSHNGINLLNH